MHVNYLMDWVGAVITFIGYIILHLRSDSSVPTIFYFIGSTLKIDFCHLPKILEFS